MMMMMMMMMVTNHCQTKAKVDCSEAVGGKSTTVRLQAQLDHLVVIILTSTTIVLIIKMTISTSVY